MTKQQTDTYRKLHFAIMAIEASAKRQYIVDNILEELRQTVY